jgi:hypothetical protein
MIVSVMELSSRKSIPLLLLALAATLLNHAPGFAQEGPTLSWLRFEVVEEKTNEAMLEWNRIDGPAAALSTASLWHPSVPPTFQQGIKKETTGGVSLNGLVVTPVAGFPESTGTQAPQGVTPGWTAREKIKYGLKQAFFTPGVYIFPAISTVFIQVRERNQPQKDTGDKVADGLSRYAIEFGTRSSKELLASGVFPIVFHQDPRYKPSPKRGFGSRLLYAASRVFVTHSDDGKSQLNISLLSGSVAASALANIWERNTPGHDRIGIGPTFRRFGTTVGFDAVGFIFKEFWPDIKRKLFRR